MLRSASPADVPEILALLAASKLPTGGVSEHLETLVLFESGGSIAGVGGLELYGPSALLRSLAVAPAHGGRGLAEAICDHLEAEARLRNVETLYLLTETAERFFSKRGYLAVPRAEAPPAIASTEEFSTLCPQSAILMRRAA